MDKDTQRLIGTFLGIGLIIALVVYILKHLMNLGNGKGFGLGGPGGDALAPSGAVYSAPGANPDYSPAAIIPGQTAAPKHSVLDLLHQAAQKLSVASGKGPIKEGDYSAMLFDADNASKAFIGKFGKDPKISWDLFHFSKVQMPDDAQFKSLVLAWMKKAHYKKLTDTAIYQSGASNVEIADFINRAANEAKIK